MSRFYLLNRNSDPNVLGIKNGIKQADVDRTGFKNPEKFDQLKECLGTNKYWDIKDSIIHMNFEIQCVRMLPKAKLTNFLQFGPALMNCPFLISESVASLFANYKILNSRLFPAEVMSGQNKFTYYMFYVESISYEMIDFSKSVFFSGSEITGKKLFSFGCAEERVSFLKKNPLLLREEEIWLSGSFPTSDLFALGAQIIISEKLKIDIEDFSLCSGSVMLPAYGEVPWMKLSQE